MAMIHTESRKQKAESRDSNPASCLLPPARYSRGFTLLIAVIFMSVMLAFGLELASLAYKQQVLASSAIESQYAFYAADAGLECALYADQQLNSFNYSTHDSNTPPNLITCDNGLATQLSYSYDSNKLIVAERLSLDSSTLTPHCAYVTVYKYSTPQSPKNFTTYIFSQGYDVSCSVVASPNGARFLSRGLSAYH
jgi:Tfp pilus assembly protein PilX